MKRVARNPRRRAATKPSETSAPATPSVPRPRAPRPTAHSTNPPARIHPQHREFARLAVIRGTSDPIALARDAGFADPSRGPDILLRLQDLIERERLTQKLGASMDLEESLRIVGDLARNADDPKLKLAACRTVLELHGALNAKGSQQDRSALSRQLEAMVSELRDASRGKANGRAPRIRARMQIDVDTAPDDVTHTPSSAIDTAAITVSHKK